MNSVDRDDEKGTAQPTALDTARYIAELTDGMSVLARGAGLDVVAYLLDMARIEAEETVQRGPLT